MAKKEKKATRVLWFGDVHWSDRDERAVALVEKAARVFRPDIIVDMGDLLNCDAFSRHPKQHLDDDAEYDYVEAELSPAKAWSVRMESLAGKRYVQMAGNHDAWFSRWLAAVDDGRRAFRSLDPQAYMSAGRSKKFSYVPYCKQHGDRKGTFKIEPGVLFVHGWAAPKHAAERHLQLGSPYSVIYAHTHRAETRSKIMYDGKYVMAMNAGCLCKQQPKYAHGGSPSEWTQGFGVLYAGSKSFTAYPIAIHGSSVVLPDGREIKL